MVEGGVTLDTQFNKPQMVGISSQERPIPTVQATMMSILSRQMLLVMNFGARHTVELNGMKVSRYNRWKMVVIS